MTIILNHKYKNLHLILQQY